MCQETTTKEYTDEGEKTTILLKKCAKAELEGRRCGDSTAPYSPPSSNASHLSPQPQFAPLDHIPPTPPRSAHSSDSERSSKRRSGTTTYVSGSAAYDIPTSPSRRERSERVYYDTPQSPISRSPGRGSDVTHHESRRPRRDSVVADRGRTSSTHGSRRSSSHSRPASLRVNFVDATPKKSNKGERRHSRHGSREGSDTSEDLHQRRMDELYLASKDERRHDERRQEARRERAMRDEIARQNDAINNRPAAPPSSAPVPRSSKDKYRRGSVAFDPQADLNSSMARLHMKEDKERQRRAREQERMMSKESEAQEKRLRERMNAPKRRNSVVAARPTVTFDDPYAQPYIRPRGGR